jgi:hypothetical protein
MREIVAAVRRAIPDPASAPPGAVLEHVLSAQRQADAKLSRAEQQSYRRRDSNHWVFRQKSDSCLDADIAIGHKRIGLDRLSLRGLSQGERACRPSSSAAPARKAKSYRREPSSLSKSAHSLWTPGLAPRGFELLGNFLWQAAGQLTPSHLKSVRRSPRAADSLIRPLSPGNYFRITRHRTPCEIRAALSWLAVTRDTDTSTKTTYPQRTRVCRKGGAR